ncbi:MFS transporter [Klebsiella pneumoniae subsp. pneumoniae]|nr:MFS transporter [Klebsiella pneumoniae subsp. pneumoniae]
MAILLAYYTDIYVFVLAVMGTTCLLVRLDAITDPIMGAIADATFNLLGPLSPLSVAGDLRLR